MKKILSIIMVAMLGSMAASAGQSLRISLTDGTEILCNLEKEPQMSFGDKTIVLTSLEGTVGEWSFANVDYWTFEETEGIADIKKDINQVRIEDGRITVNGSTANGIAVYDISGKKVLSAKGKGGDAVNIDLNGLAKGTYILKMGKNSVKFIAK